MLQFIQTQKHIRKSVISQFKIYISIVGPGAWGKIGTVVSVLSLASDITQTTLRMISNVEKKIVVSIANLEGSTWEGL